MEPFYRLSRRSRPHGRPWDRGRPARTAGARFRAASLLAGRWRSSRSTGQRTG
ncbi:MAG: hypothetical protein M0C28_29080 [Candidatus Moduliflexus flocculans]|nr:hypothetical protein [Candidatus Moduliflexus flocculans]